MISSKIIIILTAMSIISYCDSNKEENNVEYRSYVESHEEWDIKDLSDTYKFFDEIKAAGCDESDIPMSPIKYCEDFYIRGYYNHLSDILSKVQEKKRYLTTIEWCEKEKSSNESE
ncbi:uncharacterized protein LOC113558784 isoform X2 [Rhopalosiphum maidis]|uniref:uncharacterized protein LOC113558784 isoform X2 n=1 Tax=Rhopalosiphum maidis TaxID=43146 RepID=UPI000EFE948A|nr:uncharacterized protein LOC113558784 isoform X2 [Rhopalosiphum maidis]